MKEKAPLSLCARSMQNKGKQKSFTLLRRTPSSHHLCCQKQDSQEHGGKVFLLEKLHVNTELLTKLRFLCESKRRLRSSLPASFETQPVTCCKTQVGVKTCLYSAERWAARQTYCILIQDKPPDLSTPLPFLSKITFKLAKLSSMPYQKLWWDNLITCEGRGRVETEQEIKGKKVRDAFTEQLPLSLGKMWPEGPDLPATREAAVEELVKGVNKYPRWETKTR